MPIRERRQGSRINSWIGKLFMMLVGWHVVGQMPDCRKVVVIAAPHTSNWDFVLLLAVAFSLRVRIHWLGKNSLFKPPFGGLLRGLGGIPVDRSRATNLVTQLTQRFDATTQLAVVIPPSGTRGKTEHWRSGFYWTAKESGATVVCGFLDYPKRTAGLGYAFIPSGNVKRDMDAVRDFYRGIEGKYPELTSVIRLKEESI